jgi:hypothetical protein
MNNWQFLIQKQGERRWHPLESATVELPEGKYRVVANSNYVNTDVEVRVTHYSHYESPPKRHVKKRSRRTNADGVMAVIPFTVLKPGSWELRCSGDLMSDIMGRTWKFSVRLEVLPDEAALNFVSDMGSDGFFDDHLDSSTPKRSAGGNRKSAHGDVESLVTSADLDENHMGDATITISAEEVKVTSSQSQADGSSYVVSGEDAPLDWNYTTINIKDTFKDLSFATRQSAGEENQELDGLVTPAILKGETAEQILHNLADLALPTTEPALDELGVAQSPAQAVELPLAITLASATYFVAWGEALTIQGGVELKDGMTLKNRIYGGELRIELRSPLGDSGARELQTGAAIARITQPVTKDTLPFNFCCELQVPGDCPSKLILADIYLYAALDANGEAMLLASNTFTVNATVTELLALSAVAQAQTSEELLNSSEIVVVNTTQEETKVSTSLDLQLFDLVKTLPKEQSLVTQPKVKISLPPRINPYSLQKPASLRSPQLPFSNEQNSRPTDVRIKTQSRALPYLKKLPVISSPEENQSPEVTNNNPQIVESPLTVEKENWTGELTPVLPQEAAIPSNAELITTTDNPDALSPLIRQWIKTQGYTLSQPINLQYQDYDTEQIFLHELDVDPGIAASTDPDSLENPPQPAPALPQLPPLISHQQKPTWLTQEIVVDDIALPIASPEEQTPPQQPSIEPPLPLLSSQETVPLPVPEVYVPKGELIAGKPIKIRIVLPNLGPHIAIKLWIKDCQTRRLLQEPRIWKSWLYHSPDCLQQTVNLEVPLGCLEIQFEAIAIDLTTQQESHKVSITRSVIPEGLPQIPIEELIAI